MAKNLKALTIEELASILSTYSFDYKGGYIHVSCKGYDRTTVHSPDKDFYLSTKVRKIKINQDAIHLWITKYVGTYSLIEVQNAINTLIVTYQEVNDAEIANQLAKTKTSLTYLNLY